VEEAELFIANSKFAEFVLEPWQMKGKYRELKKPVGKVITVNRGPYLERTTSY
jgi:hypothetical protein